MITSDSMSRKQRPAGPGSSADQTAGELLQAAAQSLAGEAARLEAEILLAHVLGKPLSYLRAWPDYRPGCSHAARFEALVTRRRAGEPVAYLTGEREFWSLRLAVTRDVLVPRPETELAVERALERIPSQAHWRILDLGTGSGAIALAIARERHGCVVTATERHPAALAVARRNAERLGLENVRFRLGDWWQAVSRESFHLIVSNPPYVAEDDPHLRALRAEPWTALSGGPDGLRHLRAIIRGAPPHLDAAGSLILEHGADQAGAVHTALEHAGFASIRCHRDLAGLDRVTEARLKDR